jgi:glycosyltransferase involved in cell wall biosynthesis
LKDVDLTLIGISSDKFLNEKLLTGDIGCSVSALGEVEDMKLALVEHDVSIALMTTGSGIQNKVLEAFAVGLPVVLSEKVLQGLPVENPSGFLLARNVAEFDASIATLMNPRNRRIMGEGNRIHCEQNYNWQSGIRKLQKNILSKV